MEANEQIARAPKNLWACAESRFGPAARGIWFAVFPSPFTRRASWAMPDKYFVDP